MHVEYLQFPSQSHIEAVHGSDVGGVAVAVYDGVLGVRSGEEEDRDQCVFGLGGDHRDCVADDCSGEREREGGRERERKEKCHVIV